MKYFFNLIIKASTQPNQTFQMSSIKNISLYIPHVFPNFSKEYIADAFKNIGEVSDINFVAKKDRKGKDYNAVYVHFSNWHTSKKAIAFYETVVDDIKEARLYHDDTCYYWIVLPNIAKKHISGERKPRIDLGENKSITASKHLSTPVKEQVAKVCPSAPVKRSYAEVITPKEEIDEIGSDAQMDSELAEFDAEFQAFMEEADIEHEMNEVEELMNEEDINLVTVDMRYIQAIEEENWTMRQDIAQLRAALINLDQMYQAETAKARAFSGVELQK